MRTTSAAPLQSRRPAYLPARLGACFALHARTFSRGGHSWGTWGAPAKNRDHGAPSNGARPHRVTPGCLAAGKNYTVIGLFSCLWGVFWRNQGGATPSHPRCRASRRTLADAHARAPSEGCTPQGAAWAGFCKRKPAAPTACSRAWRRRWALQQAGAPPRGGCGKCSPSGRCARCPPGEWAGKHGAAPPRGACVAIACDQALAPATRREQSRRANL